MNEILNIISLEQLAQLFTMIVLLLLVVFIPLAAAHLFKKWTNPKEYVTKKEYEEDIMNHDKECVSCRTGIQREMNTIKTLVLLVAMKVGVPEEKLEKLVER
jgi:hypothetical protein